MRASVIVRLTRDEALVLVTMRNPCEPGSDEWKLAASGRQKIEEAMRGAEVVEQHPKVVPLSRDTTGDNR